MEEPSSSLLDAFDNLKENLTSDGLRPSKTWMDPQTANDLQSEIEEKSDTATPVVGQLLINGIEVEMDVSLPIGEIRMADERRPNRVVSERVEYVES